MRHRDPASDRLATAIFIVALAHGLLIMGVRFTAPANDRPLPTLEIMLVPSGPDDPDGNESAAYLAQRTQKGTGTGLDAGRTSLPETTPQDPDPGARPVEPEAEQSSPEEPLGAVSVLARRALGAQRLPAGADRPESPPVFYAQPAPAPPTVGLNAAIADRELQLRGQRSVDGNLLADTRESIIAAYLDGWKRRIERVGTLNFPNEARRSSLSGNPVVEVAIRADG